jgi:preprotein translocase subunit SecG
MTWLFPTLVVLFAVISLAMVLIILVQRPQGGGLASAFGGGGNQDTAFGGRTGDALTIATVSTFVLWLLVAIGLNVTDGITATEPAVTPVAEAAIAPEPQPSVSFTPEETQQLISPTAPSTIITPDRPVIQPGLEGFPSETPPPPPEPAEPAPAPAAEPAPAPAANP